MQTDQKPGDGQDGSKGALSVHSGKSLISSASWSLTGHILPLGVALLAIPKLLHTLGDERFGLLTLFWVLAGYFTVLDLGLGRALVLGFSRLRPWLDRKEIGSIFWAGFFLLGLVGLAMAIGLQFAATWIADLLGVSAELREEAAGGIRLVGWTMPATLLLPAVVALPTAFQYQRGLTLLRIPAGVASHLIPLLMVSFFTRDLRDLMLANLGLRVFLLAAHMVYLVKIHPLDFPRTGLLGHARSLVSTSLWMMLTNMVAPLLMNMDRLLISGGQGPAMLSSYAPAMDFTQKLFTLFSVIMSVVFPAIGAHFANDPASARTFYRQATRTLVLWAPPLFFLAGGLSYPAMRIWLGEAHGETAGRIFATLLVGCLAGLPGGISSGAVQAAGGAREASLFHLSQAFVFVGLFWFGLQKGDLFVVAWIWSMRHAVDSLGMHLLACSRGGAANPSGTSMLAYPSSLVLMSTIALVHGLHPWAGVLLGVVLSVAWTVGLATLPEGRESIPWTVRDLATRSFARFAK